MFYFVFQTNDWRGICFALSLADMSGKLKYDKYKVPKVHAIL